MRALVIVGGAMALALSSAAAPAVLPAKPAAGRAEMPLFPVRAEADSGKIIATFPKPDAQGVSGHYLYLSQIASGIGAPTTGYDFGGAGNSRLLSVKRIGKKVVFEVDNPRFVADAGDPAAKAGIARDFPRSVIWAADIIATNPNGSFTVDLAPFTTRDDGLALSLRNSDAGDFSIVPELSVADPAAVKAFPRNVELEATLTFKATKPSEAIANVLPDQTLTLRVRHSLIALPEPGFVTRHDPYGYSIANQVYDYSAPLGQPMVENLATRFRLEKKDPAAARSEVVKPIVYYVDRAAPQPVRQALIDGVAWWKSAFDAAGFVNAFEVKELPAGVDPLDIRYNVVNWVNRATRGWSYGQPISDPRTGEIIKGAVVLGSLRVRQDILIFQALVGANLTGTGDPNDPITAALARIRQLGAHEVGHSLGFAHNFAASTQDRYSVMDYPPPRIGFDGQNFTIADAYGVGIGKWDKFLVKWLYGARTDVDAAPVVAEARRDGLRFVADPDARPVSSGEADGAIWDDGADSVAELRRVSAIRRAAVDRFSFNAVPPGASMAELRRAFVPIWLLDRYQIEAAAKKLGGIDFPFVLAGEHVTARPVSASEQQQALSALLATLEEPALTVPPHLLSLLSGGSSENDDRQSTIEQLPTAGRDIFDPLKATEIGAVQTLDSLLDPARLNRLEAQSAADPGVPSPLAVVNALLDQVMRGNSAVQRRIATTAILALARSARSPSLSPVIAVQIDARLDRLADQMERARGDRDASDWQHGMGVLLKDRQALDKAIADPARLPQVPPGMPIG